MCVCVCVSEKSIVLFGFQLCLFSCLSFALLDYWLISYALGQCYQWRNAEIPPYKHSIAPHGSWRAFLHNFAYGGWQQIHHAILPLRGHNRYLTTPL